MKPFGQLGSFGRICPFDSGLFATVDGRRDEINHSFAPACHIPGMSDKGLGNILP